jgi:FMN reductase
MPDIVAIAGSPSEASRSLAVVEYARRIVSDSGFSSSVIRVRDLDPEDLLYGRVKGHSILQSTRLIEEARAVIITTPVYKASFSGVLKAFLDLLPQNAFNNKVVLPFATGGSPAHLLAIDYALKPVLSALGASQILAGTYIVDSQIQPNAAKTGYELDWEIERRISESVKNLSAILQAQREQALV